ncbi:SDR family NAD(P)-dependent oxidoreductase [Wenzhouxiangella sp. XN79A]|uniref:SDR family NAD(P)-dependent oxidoreductase n=1 Tax=Wenzhouxiangella sp. XN79A TaxID=2724193 RepID=UPI00144AEC4F|nr:SDR family NAD(P)-dependent oxidoreductase [Wenzhouxiangella sp. XN79A]NKI36032.1 SDR family NAD(P)-dependent oxidoreductase [Wenzhouxiangella sp. XN79A]
MNEDVSRVVLVTGAAGALGSALVRRVLADGADCIALDRDRRGLERLHDGLAAEGRAPLVVPLDLAGAGPDHYVELAESLHAEFGHVDAVIHAAAEFKGLRTIENLPPDEWMQELQAGVTGPMLLTRALLPLLRKSPDGRVVFVIDDPEARAAAYWAGYGVAQSAVRALAAMLGAECRKHGPAVTTVDPGPFYSGLRSRVWPAEDPRKLPTAEAAADIVLAALDARH